MHCLYELETRPCPRDPAQMYTKSKLAIVVDIHAMRTPVRKRVSEGTTFWRRIPRRPPDARCFPALE
ncbi:hypothetical protein C8Q79DRAFT_981348 [Trametes meyenii]|nr:hypothetical protein C8Q79DRAFT_981348 [Trametes meyenii]